MYDNFLNKDGFQTSINFLWNKIKSIIPKKVSELENDIGYQTEKYIHPLYTPKTSGLYKITIDDSGHVSNVEKVTKADILELGIISEDSFEIDEEGNLYFNY